ncbi:uncharacterized protein A1O5_06519 [Cladophialophora psammophila CBS 110553]|uniref:Transcription factor domain-containing protein n=1 Tax=Cladophialophora psammophila CBS 110553 TaxID=1182543 RepID=W9WZG6_9EURO|nr:uncharacterized protein A1O5_06519 [Cladophialophora psammophila CBS 110553]EXJ70450.1 hypothetical protein A1O5_06519 [Cladophialophora psammophila CBS 110553]
MPGSFVIQEPLAQSQQSYIRAPTERLFPSSQSSMAITYPLSQSVHDLGANFFFAKYSPDDGPFFSNYHAWLVKSYFGQGPNNVLRAVIEAVGMAGLSNVFYAPRVKSQCHAQYCTALISMQKALNNPVQAISDTTFMALILLAFFETVSFGNRDRYHHWAAHVRAGTAILELRGREQFLSERGGLLYVQFRSSILLFCMHEHVAVPNAMVKATFSFQTGALRQDWQHANIASPGSITEICIRVVNLWAGLKSQEATDPQAIRAIALELDWDLETWKAGLSPAWGYTVVHVPGAPHDVCFDGKKHIYPNLWIAEAWNYWRALRVLVNQITLQNEVRLTEPDDARMALACSIIQQLCNDICISTYSFKDTPRN